ncbi:MAG: DMT family transporter [Rubrivivax sp.]|nr:DMT family transporter [Rubrivivax sp.]
MTPSRRAQVLLWVVPALWSSNYLIARLASGVIAPHQLALGRWSLALAFMLPFVGPRLWRDRALWRREWKQLLVLGALGMWICGAFVYLGGQTTSATNIGLIYAATPIAIVAAGTRLLHERMSRWQVAGVVLALAGVLYVIAQGRLENLLAVQFTVGDAWIVAAAASWAAYSVLLRVWPSALGPAERLAAISAAGVLVLLPFTALEAWAQPQPALSLPALGLVLVAALVPGVLSYTAYSYMQRELGAARTALVMYLSPVYAAFSAWAVLGEAPGWHHAVGAALILPSIALATRRQPVGSNRVTLSE